MLYSLQKFHFIVRAYVLFALLVCGVYAYERQLVSGRLSYEEEATVDLNQISDVAGEDSIFFEDETEELSGEKAVAYLDELLDTCLSDAVELEEYMLAEIAEFLLKQDIETLQCRYEKISALYRKYPHSVDISQVNICLMLSMVDADTRVNGYSEMDLFDMLHDELELTKNCDGAKFIVFSIYQILCEHYSENSLNFIKTYVRHPNFGGYQCGNYMDNAWMMALQMLSFAGYKAGWVDLSAAAASNLESDILQRLELVFENESGRMIFEDAIQAFMLMSMQDADLAYGATCVCNLVKNQSEYQKIASDTAMNESLYQRMTYLGKFSSLDSRDLDDVVLAFAQHDSSAEEKFAHLTDACLKALMTSNVKAPYLKLCHLFERICEVRPEFAHYSVKCLEYLQENDFSYDAENTKSINEKQAKLPPEIYNRMLIGAFAASQMIPYYKFADFVVAIRDNMNQGTKIDLTEYMGIMNDELLGWNTIASSLEWSGFEFLATRVYTAIIFCCPQDSMVKNNLGYLLFSGLVDDTMYGAGNCSIEERRNIADNNKNVFGVAQKLIVSALLWQPYNVLYHDSLGWCYYCCGKDDEAKREFWDIIVHTVANQKAETLNNVIVNHIMQLCGIDYRWRVEIEPLEKTEQ